MISSSDCAGTRRGRHWPREFAAVTRTLRHRGKNFSFPKRNRCNLTYITFFCRCILRPAATSGGQWAAATLKFWGNKSLVGGEHKRYPHGRTPQVKRKTNTLDFGGWGVVPSERPADQAAVGRNPFWILAGMMDGFRGMPIHMEMLHHKYLHSAAVSMLPLLVLTHWEKKAERK